MNNTKKLYDTDTEEIPDYKDAAKCDEIYDDFDYLGIEKENEEIKNKNKAEMEKKAKYLKSRKKDLNSQAKNLMKEFHNKTHFKGVTSMVNLNKNSNSLNLYLISYDIYKMIFIYFF